MSGRATFSGIATDLKAGAALRLDDGRLVLIEGRHSWGRARQGARIAVSGRLRQEPATAPDPSVQQAGGGWYLEDAEEVS
jgi:hypothetical protein